MSRYLLINEAIRDEMLERRASQRQMREAYWRRSLPDMEFINTFRVNREVFEALCLEIVPLLPVKLSSRGIDPTMKILVALKFYGRGDYQGGVGRDDVAPMSQQTVSCCVRQVTHALNNAAIVQRHVRFPQTRHERNQIKTGFYNKFGMPGVCGAIDCTHIKIIRPPMNEERFFNRKHYHSLNVQMICDDKNKILNVDASYGGATHDSFVWHNSNIREHFETLCGTGETAVLLGDSGYPLRVYMMTPVDGATEDSPEGRYNAIQKRARSTIERTFGILKGRWRCLLAVRALHYCPETAGRITIACSVLHNICVAARLPPLELQPDDVASERAIQPSADADPRVSSAAEALRRGREARHRLILTLIR